MIHARPLCILLSAVLLLGTGCRRAEEVQNPPEPLGNREAPSFAGQVVLAAGLGRARAGSVTIRVWRAGEAEVAGSQPFLSRSYPLDDPDWSADAGARRHYFGLCEADRVGDSSRGLPAEIEIEACYDPGQGTGLVRASVPARNGAKDIALTVVPQIETAQPQGTRKKDG